MAGSQGNEVSLPRGAAMCLPPDPVGLDFFVGSKGNLQEKKTYLVEKTTSVPDVLPLKPSELKGGSKNGGERGPHDWPMFGVKPSNVKTSTIF